MKCKHSVPIMAHSLFYKSCAPDSSQIARIITTGLQLRLRSYKAQQWRFS
jgi:hypothetical protein